MQKIIKTGRFIEDEEIHTYRSIDMPYELLFSDAKLIKRFKTALELEHKYVKPIFEDGADKVVRTTITDDNDPLLLNSDCFKIREYHLKSSTVRDETSLVGFATAFLKKYKAMNVEELVECLPVRYTIYSPLLLFNYSNKRSYSNTAWKGFFKDAGEEVRGEYFRLLLAKVFPKLQLTHVAINMPIIESDIMRRPFNICPLYGEMISPTLNLSQDELWNMPTSSDLENTLWCHTTQNGIHQYWAPMFSMFSRGNIKEKKRIIDTFQDIKGNDVVDMYAGIGYFTLSYLKMDARRLFCFELNPWSVEALRRGIQANNFDKHRCYIFNESNKNCVNRIRETDLNDMRIRHINLGLLPTSKQGWPLCIELITLQHTHTHNSIEVVTLHIHENVHAKHLEDNSFVKETLEELLNISDKLSYKATHLEKIKTFAPDVWHICLDVDVTST